MTLTSYDLEAYRIHFNSQGKPKELLGHRSKVQTLAWSSEGDKLASGGSDGSIRIWSLEKMASTFASSSNSKSNLSSRELAQNLSIEVTSGKHSKIVNQLQWCPFDSSILASCSSDKSVKIWRVSAELVAVSALSIEVEVEVLALCWHPKEPLLAVGTKEDKVLIFRLNQLDSASLIETLKFGSEVNELAWSPSGEDLSVALGFGEVDVFDCRSWSRKQSLKAHTADCFCVKYFCGELTFLLAVGSSDSQVTIWKRASCPDSRYNCVRVLNRMEWPIRAVSFSHDGEFLAVGSEDPFIAVEHIQTGSLVTKIATGKSSSDSRAGIPMNSVAWNPKSNILAFAGSEVDDRTGRATGSIKVFGLS